MPPSPNSLNDEFIPTRVSLLNRLKDLDDQRSWQEFFDTYWKMLYSVARRSGLNETEAQDIVQETIAGVARKMPEFSYDAGRGSFKSWLSVIVRRRIIDYLRRAGREPLRQEPAADAASSGATDMMERIPDPDDGQIERIYEEEWQKGIFEAALERVKRKVGTKHFQIFDCYAIKGWAVEVVSKNLSVSADLVYTTKHRVTELLKEEVARLEKSMG
jgi:RNA polymerase sigma factor (sigma-70 family)